MPLFIPAMKPASLLSTKALKWCDQAFVYFRIILAKKAYGNVRFLKGDTVSMQSNYGEYNGNTSLLLPRVMYCLPN